MSFSSRQINLTNHHPYGTIFRASRCFLESWTQSFGLSIPTEATQVDQLTKRNSLILHAAPLVLLRSCVEDLGAKGTHASCTVKHPPGGMAALPQHVTSGMLGDSFLGGQRHHMSVGVVGVHIMPKTTSGLLACRPAPSTATRTSGLSARRPTPSCIASKLYMPINMTRGGGGNTDVGGAITTSAMGGGRRSDQN